MNRNSFNGKTCNQTTWSATSVFIMFYDLPGNQNAFDICYREVIVLSLLVAVI